MKSTNRLFKKAVIVPFVLIALSSFSQPKFNAIDAMEVNNPTRIEFLRAEMEYLVFEVNLDQIPDKGCFLKISDESGEVLFEKRIISTSYRQIYRIQRNNSSKFSFEASGKNFHVKESFNLQYKMEEKIEVTKL